MPRWDGESNETIYERDDMGNCADEVKYGVVEWVKKEHHKMNWSHQEGEE